MFRFLIAILLTSAVAALNANGPNGPNVPNDPNAIRHALSRLTFGPRPGDVERVRAMGLGAWIDRQLDPGRIDDDALAARLPQIAAPSGASGREARREARAAVTDLASARLVRAAYSERQLEELLVDVWFNHFNVFAGKGRVAIFLPAYERDAIRPHVLGRFRDLLGATAQHPAMLFYLDNWLSVNPNAQDRKVAGNRQVAARKRGLNENYARELLELHTLGVDGGYSQDDIVNVARAFTGWTIGPNQAFRFARAQHDEGVKTVLGRRLPAGGGVRDGELVLDIVAAHPSTARHIATKLARRFVSDTPPDALVARAAARFTETGGDLREVVRTIVTSPEFFAPEARQAKVKTPLEFVVSAVRTRDAGLPEPQVLVRALRQLGMPLYMCQPPTGYDDTAESWISPGALVTRINVAQQIAGDDAGTVSSPEFQRR
jgi:uncharacterized protein (DUF1800 family)